MFYPFYVIKVTEKFEKNFVKIKPLVYFDFSKVAG